MSTLTLQRRRDSKNLEQKVADEVWIATALLHREQPDKSDFSVKEIVERAAQEAGDRPIRPGVYQHIYQHAVANRDPSSGRYRLLYETAPGRRRLFRRGDPYHPRREGAKLLPDRADILPLYHELLNWYERWCAQMGAAEPAADRLLALRGSGKHLWATEHADEYVRRLRQGWE